MTRQEKWKALRELIAKENIEHYKKLRMFDTQAYKEEFINQFAIRKHGKGVYKYHA